MATIEYEIIGGPKDGTVYLFDNEVKPGFIKELALAFTIDGDDMYIRKGQQLYYQGIGNSIKNRKGSD